MPRSPYFSGALASGGQVRGPDRVPGFMEVPGQLESAIGKAFGGMFYNPQNDPDAQRARLYGAQADKAETDADLLNAQARARMGLPELMGAMTGAPTNRYDVRPEGEAAPGDMRLTEEEHRQADLQDRDRAQQAGLFSLLSGGVEGEDASKIMAALGAAMGDNDDVARYRAAAAGNYLGVNDAVSIDDQVAVAERNFTQRDREQTADLDQRNNANERDNITRLAGYQLGFDSDVYTADSRERTSRYDTDVDAETDLQMNTDDNSTSRWTTAYDNFIDNLIADRDRDQRRESDVRTDNTRRDSRGGSGTDRRRPRPPKPAPAPAAPAPTPARPPRIRLDRDGNPR